MLNYKIKKLINTWKLMKSTNSWDTKEMCVFLNVQYNAFFTKLADQFNEKYFYIGLFVLLKRQISMHK